MLFFVTIVAYVVVLLGVGVWKSRTTKTQDDFMVAGRSVRPGTSSARSSAPGSGRAASSAGRALRSAKGSATCG